jgi:hypothetical protein
MTIRNARFHVTLKKNFKHMKNRMTTATKILFGVAWINLILWILERMEITHFGIERYLGISLILICLLILFALLREKSKEMK